VPILRIAYSHLGGAAAASVDHRSALAIFAIQMCGLAFWLSQSRAARCVMVARHRGISCCAPPHPQSQQRLRHPSKHRILATGHLHANLVACLEYVRRRHQINLKLVHLTRLHQLLRLKRIAIARPQLPALNLDRTSIYFDRR